MKRIFKYRVIIDDQFTIDMPKGAVLLSLQTQQEAPQIWAIVDEQADMVKRRFAMRGTGHPVDGLEEATFVGTFQIRGGALVFHVFDLGEG